MQRRIFLSVLICAVLALIGWALPRIPLRHIVAAQVDPATADRKLIEVGWDTPTVAYLHANLAQLQDRPFDGMCFRFVRKIPLAFENRQWTDADVNLPLLDQVQWGKYTDNFLLMWGQSDPMVDWFDNTQWDIIAANMRLTSHALKLVQAKGVMFDPEFYFTRTTHSPWMYDTTIYPNHTFEQVEAQVRQRGAAFITALQTEMPTLQFLSMWLVGEAYARAGERLSGLAGSHYALLPSFLYGILDAKGDAVTPIDGNERSYYHDEATDFVSLFAYERFSAAALVPPDERDRYIQQVQIAAAVYPDYVMALRDFFERGWPEEMKLRWLEHNTYHALVTTEHYAWVWNEMLNWWGYDQTLDSNELGASTVPANVLQAITNARQRFTSGQALDFEMVYIGGSAGSKVTDTEFLTTPTVTLTTPEARTEFAHGEVIRLNITVDGADSFDRTELYVNAVKVGNATSTYDLQGLTTGDYLVFARTFTSEGKHRTSNLLPIRIR